MGDRRAVKVVEHPAAIIVGRILTEGAVGQSRVAATRVVHATA